MTGSKDSDEADGLPRPLKWLAALIPLMAAALPIIGAFGHWFDTSSHTTPASSSEYVEVCGRANESQQRLEDDYSRYAIAFEHARDLTSARDALLLVIKQEMAATSDLKGRIDALTPASNSAGAQRALDEDWGRNLAALGRFRERLSEGVGSLAEMVEIVRRQPRLAIASRSADARARLRQLGKQDCDLNTEPITPNVDWSPALRREWALVRARSSGSVGATKSASTDAKGSVTPQVLPEASAALPEAEPPQAIYAPAPSSTARDHISVTPEQAIGEAQQEGQVSTSTAP